MTAPFRFTAVLFLHGFNAASAQINVQSDGSDGVFNPSGNVIVDLSLARTGVWNESNSNPASSGKGIYDPAKRAIVFKYSSVTIAAGRTVTFKNHPSRAAVVWLVQDDVTIAGSLSLAGSGVAGGTSYQEPGPGGFRGGPNAWYSAGLGIGGGTGSYYGGSAAGRFSSIYGNPSCIPLIGGSGAGGQWSQNGAGGGGAVLIASGKTISISGALSANSTSAGSSGAIRLVTNAISGTGTISASNEGRIRLEANNVSGTFLTTPQTIPVLPSVPPTLWPAETAPKVKIVSIDAVPAPADPTAPLDVTPDVAISKELAATSVVVLQTQYFSVNGTVKLRAAGKYSSSPSLTNATFQSGDYNQATWTVTLPFAEGFTTLQAIATAP